jgi:S1-C subfamily serine protease
MERFAAERAGSGTMVDVDLLDALIIVWVVLAAIAGYRRGAALQLTEYAGLLVGLLAGALIAPKIATLATSTQAQAAIALIVLLVMAAIGEGIGWVIGHKAWSAARRSVLRGVDAVGGSLVGIAAVLLVIWFVAYSLAAGPFPAVSRQIRSSAIVHTLNDVMPRPPALLADVRQFLGKFGFPEVFADLPPFPAGPVQEPSNPTVRTIADRADPSVVKVVGGACNEILSGSGFVAARHYVVSNAHVVAGVRAPHVEGLEGGTFAATVVLFDPRTDIAILSVPGFEARPLQLDPDEIDRGAQGAVIGHPGGGTLVALPAGVRRTMDALGRDIYGESVVQRRIYELQAVVRPGDSGGPFVLKNGEVAGVVFAASTTDPHVGYALTSPGVLSLLQKADHRTAAVSTGSCAR